MLAWWLLGGVGVVGVLGALASMHSHKGGTALAPILTGMVSVALWVAITKTGLPPRKAAPLHDGVYGLAFLLTLYTAGEPPTWQGALGATMVLCGLVLVAWR